MHTSKVKSKKAGQGQSAKLFSVLSSLFCSLLNRFMQDYKINVTQIEELQTISNTNELETIFARAKSAIVNGAKVILVRKEASGRENKFDEIDTLETLDAYQKGVFKYLQ
jgi:hypothetical protein